jgi:hypothetical protein
MFGRKQAEDENRFAGVAVTGTRPYFALAFPG